MCHAHNNISISVIGPIEASRCVAASGNIMENKGISVFSLSIPNFSFSQIVNDIKPALRDFSASEKEEKKVNFYG